MNYPCMLYRDGVLSPNPKNQRAVHDEAGELAAEKAGFIRWDGESKESPDSSGDGASIEAQQTAFEAAASGNAQTEDEAPASTRKKGVGRGRANA